MRTISKEQIIEAVKEIVMTENYEVDEGYLNALKKARDKEESELAKDVLTQMIENQDIARRERAPMCQDTGLSVFFVDLGTDIHLDCDIYEAINEGVRRGTKGGFLRSSVVKHPLKRVNTGDNTPAIVHIKLVPGDKLKIEGLAKGAGSENMSRIYMLKPNDGIEGAKKAIVEAAALAGPNACPPLVVGVGIGGNFDKAPELAKKALLREIGSPNVDPDMDKLEKDLEVEINKSGVGPQGLGGRTTAVAVFIETHPCHIASLPVAVNIQCNAHRHKSRVI